MDRKYRGFLQILWKWFEPPQKTVFHRAIDCKRMEAWKMGSFISLSLRTYACFLNPFLTKGYCVSLIVFEPVRYGKPLCDKVLPIFVSSHINEPHQKLCQNNDNNAPRITANFIAFETDYEKSYTQAYPQVRCKVQPFNESIWSTIFDEDNVVMSV